MTRQQAQQAYRRTREWEQRESARLRADILVPFFGGCGCRMHNCQVNYASGYQEYPVTVNGRVYSHRELAQLGKLFDYRQRRIWDRGTRLQAAFARYF